MRQNKVLKGLLAVSAAAALCGSLGVEAQTTETKSASQPSTSTTGTMRQQMGKDQMGKDQMGKQQMGKDHMGSSQGSAGMSGSTGTSGTGAAAAAAAPAAAAPAAATGSMSKADQKILEWIAQANIAEVEAGKMAQSKSTNDDVKKFAQQMIDDHGKALSDVQALAQQKGVTLPTEPDAKHKAMAARLDKMSGAAFDKAYMAQAGVSDHKKVHAQLMKDAKRAKDPDLKALAEKMAPAVEQHLKSAEQMHSAKSGTTSGK